LGELQRGGIRREEPGSPLPRIVAGHVPLLPTDPQGTLSGRQSAPQQHPPIDHIRDSVQGLIFIPPPNEQQKQNSSQQNSTK